MVPKRLFVTFLHGANRLGRRFQEMQRQAPSPNPQLFLNGFFHGPLWNSPNGCFGPSWAVLGCFGLLCNVSEWANMVPKRLFVTFLLEANRLSQRFQQMQRQAPSPNPKPFLSGTFSHGHFGIPKPLLWAVLGCSASF